MAMVMFAATSFAVNMGAKNITMDPSSLKNRVISPTFENFNPNVAGAEEMATRAYTDENGNIWVAQLLNYGKIEGLIGNDDQEMAWEDFPLYQVYAYVIDYGTDGYLKDALQLFLCWPAYCFFDGIEGIEITDPTLPISIEDMINLGLGTFTTMPAEYSTSLGMVSDSSFGITMYEYISCYFGGKLAYLEENSTFTLSNYVESASTMDAEFVGNYHLDGSSSSKAGYKKYSGPWFISGIKPQTYTGDFTEIHLFAGGECAAIGENFIIDEYVSDHAYSFEIPFDAVNYYKVLANNKYITPRYEMDADGNYDYTVMPEGFLILDETSTDSDYVYMMGYLYTSTDAANCYGEYTIQELKTSGDSGEYCDNVPEPGTMIPGGYYAYPTSEEAGTYLYYQGNSYTPDSGSVLKLTETDFQFNGMDFYGNTWNVSFPKLFIHDDPSDYSIAKEYTSGINRLFGDKTANLITKSNGQINVTAAENGVIAVYSTTGALVKTVKAVAGQEVSIDLDHGLYIVRVGKTASKVIL